MKSKVLFKRLMVLIFLCVITLSSFAQKIHFIMVIQESAPGSREDKTKVLRDVNNIARTCNMDIQTYVYSKEQATSLSAIIPTFTAGSDDVIWFYYSGHGANSGNGWPLMNRSVKQTDVHNTLKTKGARFTLTMFDCCDIGATTVSQRTPTLSPLISYTLMFKKTKGDIMSCASGADMYSYGLRETGGFYTTSFFESIEAAPIASENDQKRIWHNIFQETYKRTNQYCVRYADKVGKNNNNQYEQNPQFQINVVTTPYDGGSSGVGQNAPVKITTGGNEPTTLSGIVNKYKNYPEHSGLTVEKLKKWNNITHNNDNIGSGVEIWLEE